MKRWKVTYSDGEEGQCVGTVEADTIEGAWEEAREESKIHAGGDWFPIQVKEGP